MTADLAPGHTVRVLPPFAEGFAGTYDVTHVVQHDDGAICCFLFDTLGADIGAFDPSFLEIVKD